MNFRRVFVCLSAVSLATIGVVAQQQPHAADHAAIAYATSTPADRIARLQASIDAGAASLEFDPQRGYLPSLLRALEIPVSSQGLVFSRTSLQVDRIAPWTPRAVYFSDDAYVGWVQEGPIMEIATVDPKLGAVFYTLRQEQAARPVFERQGTVGGRTTTIGGEGFRFDLGPTFFLYPRVLSEIFASCLWTMLKAEWPPMSFSPKQRTTSQRSTRTSWMSSKVSVPILTPSPPTPPRPG